MCRERLIRSGVGTIGIAVSPAALCAGTIGLFVRTAGLSVRAGALSVRTGGEPCHAIIWTRGAAHGL